MEGSARFPLMAVAVSLCAGLASGQTTAAQAAYQRGAALYRSADCTGAIAELQGAVSLPAANLLLGRCYLETGQFGKAIEALTSYRKTQADDAAAAILLAQAHERDGHGPDAAALLETFLKDHPDQIYVHNALGDLYARLGQASKAMDQYHAVTGPQPEDPGARIGLGELAVREQRWQEALDEFNKAKAVVPTDYRVRLGLGTAYLGLNKCEDASGPLRQALDLAPDNFALAKKLAACDARAQKWKELLAALRTGTPEEAADEEATAMVTQAFRAVNDSAGAEAYYRRVIMAAPANVTAHTDLADLLYGAKRMPDARAEYLAVVKLKPDSARIHERLGDMADGPDKDKEARTHYEAAAKSKDGTDSARMKLAQLCFKAGDMACTTQALDGVTTAALARDVKLLKMQVEFKNQNWAAAGALANELLATDRKNLTVLSVAGEVATRQNRAADAVLLFEEALLLDPANKGLRYRLAGVYTDNEDELHRSQRAVELLTEFLSKYQQDPEAYLLLGNAYRKLNDVTNAKVNFKLGFERLVPPISPDLVWAYTAYGNMLLAEDNYDEAYGIYTQAVKLNPNNETALVNYAVTCLHLNRTDELNDARARLEKMNSVLLPQLDEQIQAAKEPPKKSK